MIEIGLLVLENFFFFKINRCKYGFPSCGSTRPQGPLCERLWIYIISESFHVNMTLNLARWFWRFYCTIMTKHGKEDNQLTQIFSK
jgi:hypothetical protein